MEEIGVCVQKMACVYKLRIVCLSIRLIIDDANTPPVERFKFRPCPPISCNADDVRVRCMHLAPSLCIFGSVWGREWVGVGEVLLKIEMVIC